MRFGQRIAKLGNVSAGALRIFRPATTFAADDRRDLLNQFVRLNLGGELLRHGCDQRDAAFRLACQENGPTDEVISVVPSNANAS